MLTHEFLEGRRARYISPLRLYLVASLVYFVLAANASETRLESGQTMFFGITFGDPERKANQPASRAERVGNAASGALESGEALSAADRAAARIDRPEGISLLRGEGRRGA